MSKTKRIFLPLLLVEAVDRSDRRLHLVLGFEFERLLDPVDALVEYLLRPR